MSARGDYEDDWSTSPLPTAQQIGMRVLGCRIHRHNDGLPAVVTLPDGEQVVTASLLLAYLTKPPPGAGDSELPGMWERADFEGGLDEERP